MIDFEYRVYQAKSPPPLFSKNCRKIAKVRRKQGGDLHSARQATSAKISKKHAKNATYSRNLAKYGKKLRYKRGGVSY